MPVVSDGDVYVALAGTLYRLNQDGSTVWTHEWTAPSAGIAVDGDRVYASNADGTLEAVDVGTGTRSWTYTPPTAAAS